MVMQTIPPADSWRGVAGRVEDEEQEQSGFRGQPMVPLCSRSLSSSPSLPQARCEPPLLVGFDEVCVVADALWWHDSPRPHLDHPAFGTVWERNKEKNYEP